MASKVEKGFGVVRSVLSGDTILLQGKSSSPSQPPVTRQLSLAFIAAPRFARSKNMTDEPHALACRDWIRRKCIGKQVAFTIVAVMAQREFAIVEIEGENVNLGLVRNGLARVVDQSRGDLVEAEDKAKKEELGVWSKVDPEKVIRSIVPVDIEKIKVTTGVKYNAVIESILDGSTMRLEVINPEDKTGMSRWSLLLHLAGIVCPPCASDKVKSDAPFAMEAKLFVEGRLLCRDVEVLLNGFDKSGNIFGSIVFSAGNITMGLIKSGLAKINWTSSFLDKKVQEELHAAENGAKNSKLKLWSTHNETDVSESSEKNTDRLFSATVVQVLSGDSVVLDDGSGERKVFFASLKAPAFNTVHGRSSKDYVRVLLIGKRVKVRVEFVDKDTREEVKREEKVMVSIFDGKLNVSEAVVLAGHCTVVKNSIQANHAADYPVLLEAETKAKQQFLGVHSKSPPSSFALPLDLSLRPVKEESDAKHNKEATNKAKQMYPHLSREKKMKGVVEHVFGGNKVKVFLEKENCLFTLLLSGIRCPFSAEPFGAESLKKTKSLCLQHNVLVTISSMDKHGNFLGSVYSASSGEDIGYSLLKCGLATVILDKPELRILEEEAKKARLGVWSLEQNHKVEETKEESKVGQIYRARVSCIINGASFYFQLVDKDIPSKSQVMQVIVPPVIGSLYWALFENVYYRAKLDSRVGDQLKVVFIDYGNVETVCASDLGVLTPDMAFPALATRATLFGCSAPSKGSEWYTESVSYFTDIALEKEFDAKVEADHSGLELTLAMEDGETINSKLMKEGLVRLKGKSSVLEELQTIAQKSRRNIWSYGVISDDEDENDR